jgi:DNA-binding NtrC family response regulator
VEDDPLVRLFASDIIEEAGFEVLEAPNATAAIATMENRQGVRVVFTDVDMPGGISGIKLVAVIRARWPTVQIIVTSGQPWPSDEPLLENVEFFPKPYRQDRVLEAVKRMAT